MSRAFQFFSPEVQQDPYPFYALARAEEPVFFCEDLGIWVATRHADATAIDPGRARNRAVAAQRLLDGGRGERRVANEDVKIGEVTIPKDGRILVLLGSANHDEGVFEEPARFDLRRPATGEHLAFGRGVHFCLGAPLARLQGRVALTALTQRLSNLRPAHDRAVRFSHVTMFRGPVSLEVAWDATPGAA